MTDALSFRRVTMGRRPRRCAAHDQHVHAASTYFSACFPHGVVAIATGRTFSPDFLALLDSSLSRCQRLPSACPRKPIFTGPVFFRLSATFPSPFLRPADQPAPLSQDHQQVAGNRYFAHHRFLPRLKFLFARSRRRKRRLSMQNVSATPAYAERLRDAKPGSLDYS